MCIHWQTHVLDANGREIAKPFHPSLEDCFGSHVKAGVNDSSGKRIAEGRTSDNAKSGAINFFVEPGGEYVLQIHYYVDGVVTYTIDVIVTAAVRSYI
jgi:hypothetical protein